MSRLGMMNRVFTRWSATKKCRPCWARRSEGPVKLAPEAASLEAGVAMSAGSASSQGRVENRLGAQRDGGACRVLLVGPEALAIRGEVEKLLPGGSPRDVLACSESILEAVLM